MRCRGLTGDEREQPCRASGVHRDARHELEQLCFAAGLDRAVRHSCVLLAAGQLLGVRHAMTGCRSVLCCRHEPRLRPAPRRVCGHERGAGILHPPRHCAGAGGTGDGLHANYTLPSAAPGGDGRARAAVLCRRLTGKAWHSRHATGQRPVRGFGIVLSSEATGILGFLFRGLEVSLKTLCWHRWDWCRTRSPRR